MEADEQEFITNALRTCQDVQNRFYSERIKVGDVNPEEPWWLSKVSLIAKNAELFLSVFVESIRELANGSGFITSNPSNAPKNGAVNLFTRSLSNLS